MHFPSCDSQFACASCIRRPSQDRSSHMCPASMGNAWQRSKCVYSLLSIDVVCSDITWLILSANPVKCQAQQSTTSEGRRNSRKQWPIDINKGLVNHVTLCALRWHLVLPYKLLSINWHSRLYVIRQVSLQWTSCIWSGRTSATRVARS